MSVHCTLSFMWYISFTAVADTHCFSPSSVYVLNFNMLAVACWNDINFLNIWTACGCKVQVVVPWPQTFHLVHGSREFKRLVATTSGILDYSNRLYPVGNRKLLENYPFLVYLARPPTILDLWKNSYSKRMQSAPPTYKWKCWFPRATMYHYQTNTNN